MVTSGLVIKGIGGFYYVETSLGILTTRGRGNLRRDGDVIKVGDRVTVKLLDDDGYDGVIEEVLLRSNCFVRPPIANVEKFVIVMSGTTPKINFNLLDRFLVVAEEKGITTIIVINKMDMIKGRETYERTRAVYGNMYDCIGISGTTGEGLDVLTDMIKGSSVALAGPSGVGKSTIVNGILGRSAMETGRISSKTSRGRHTTRHVEILTMKDGTRIFDTPGFTSIDLPNMDENELAGCFPELRRAGENCRFDNCKHLAEPECAVLKAVEDGEISGGRYESYVSFLKEVRNNNRY